MKSPIPTALTCAAALILGLMLPIAANSEPPSQANPQNTVPKKRTVTVQYFFKQPVSGYNGRDNELLGEFWMCVNIYQAHGRKYAFLWNVMTYFNRWLVINPVPLQRQPSGKLEFKFIDNLRNKGKGSIEYLSGDRIQVDTASTKPSERPPNRNILGQYGTNVLLKAACPYVRFLDGVVP